MALHPFLKGNLEDIHSLSNEVKACQSFHYNCLYITLHATEI